MTTSLPSRSDELALSGWSRRAACAAAAAVLFASDSAFAGSGPPTPAGIDRLWVLFAAALVFLMQVGFLVFETGCVRPHNVSILAQKNLGDWIVTTLVFGCCGFGLMFGSSWDGVVGSSYFLLEELSQPAGSFGAEFFLFQLAFAGTAATIVSGAMSERTGVVTYLLVATTVGLVIYPIFGHSVWGGALSGSEQPLLARLGFRDFAGGTVVHSVGGWVGLVGLVFVGPRLGRYSASNTLLPLPRASIAASVGGVLVLWLGWWGFNGGSTLGLTPEVGPIIINTNVAAASAALAAVCHAAWRQGYRDMSSKALGGLLGGLVAITPCCNVVSLPGALAIGAIAGLVHNLVAEWMTYKLRLDDPVGAVPVHLACGIWGTLAVALFGADELLPHPRLTQLGVQLVGVAACALWTCTLSAGVFWLLRRTVGLRVSPEQELAGVSIAAQLIDQHPPDSGSDILGKDELERLMGEL